MAFGFTSWKERTNKEKKRDKEQKLTIPKGNKGDNGLSLTCRIIKIETFKQNVIRDKFHKNLAFNFNRNLTKQNITRFHLNCTITDFYFNKQ